MTKVPIWFDRQVRLHWPSLRLRFVRWAEPTDGFLPLVGPPFQRIVELDGSVWLRCLMVSSPEEQAPVRQPSNMVTPGRVVLFEKLPDGRTEKVLDIVTPYGRNYNFDTEGRIVMDNIHWRCYREDDVTGESMAAERKKKADELNRAQAEAIGPVLKDWYRYLEGAKEVAIHRPEQPTKTTAWKARPSGVLVPG